jgi:ATP-dependent RNA helicase RhlE
MSFDGLGLSPELLSTVARQGYTVPTPVQAEAIPLVLAGRDLLAGAQTGTGKTAAFVLPMVQRLHASRRDGRRAVRALILAPTRELALQVEESVRTYSAGRPIRSAAIYGGVGFDPQVRALRGGAEIVVATPGRLLDHVGQRTIDLSAVEILVLDEADRMLDMGFIRDIRKILAILPAERQNLLFSATFSDDIRRLAAGLLHDPASVQVTPRNTPSELVSQVVHPVDRERKRELLSHLVKSGVIYQALVFTRTKHGANRLATQLEHDGIPATAIHGNKSQPQRVRALADFKANKYAILVATEVAARGLDIDSLPHVVNFELPMVAEDYVHRIGRTGRAGVDGRAVSLVCVDEAKLLYDIERVLGRSIPSEVIPGFEPDPRIRPEPILRGGLGGARPGAGPRQRPIGAARHAGAPSPQRAIGRPGGARPHAGARSFGPTAASPNAHRGGGHASGPNRGGHAPARRLEGGHPSSGHPVQPGQWLGQRPNHGGRPTPAGSIKHGGPRSNHGPRPDHASRPNHGPRPNSAPTALPGERLARTGGGRVDR